MKKHSPISTPGFTLVELMVAVAIFTIVTGIVSGLFMTAIKAQRRILAQQELLDQTSFVMDYMSRALRTSKKEVIPPRCLSQGGISYELTRAGNGVKFVNASGECQEFYYDSVAKQLRESKEGSENIITSPRLQVTAFRLKIVGESDADYFQPRVTFSLDVAVSGTKPEEQSTVKVQTTVSQRNLDM